MSSSCKCLFCVCKHDSDSIAERRLAENSGSGKEKLVRRSRTKLANSRSFLPQRGSRGIPRRAEPSQGQQHSGVLCLTDCTWQSLVAFYWPIYQRRRAALLLTRYFLVEKSKIQHLLPTTAIGLKGGPVYSGYCGPARIEPALWLDQAEGAAAAVG